MIVDQDAHPPHHLPSRSRHESGTACHDRQALVPPWAPLAHALAHSRGDGHQAQPEGLETIPSRSAQGWDLPREARSRLERSVEASIAHVSRVAVCHMPGSDLAATARDQTSRAERPRSERSYVVGVQYHLVWSDSLLSHLPSLGTDGSVPCTPRCRLLLDPVLRLLRRNSSVNRGSSLGTPGLRCAPPRSHTLIPTHAQHTSCRAEVYKAYALPTSRCGAGPRGPLPCDCLLCS